MKRLWNKPHEIPAHCRSGWPFFSVRWPSGTIVGSYYGAAEAHATAARVNANSEPGYKARVWKDY